MLAGRKAERNAAVLISVSQERMKAANVEL
jgi:hypothetical protein